MPHQLAQPEQHRRAPRVVVDADQRGNRVQRVEQEVRMDLEAQRVELGARAAPPRAATRGARAAGRAGGRRARPPTTSRTDRRADRSVNEQRTTVQRMPLPYGGNATSGSGIHDVASRRRRRAAAPAPGRAAPGTEAVAAAAARSTARRPPERPERQLPHHHPQERMAVVPHRDGDLRGRDQRQGGGRRAELTRTSGREAAVRPTYTAASCS